MPNPGYRSSPLTDDDIIKMREMRASGGKTSALSYLSKLFDTTLANAHLIVTGQTHKNVGGPITGIKGPTCEADVVAIRCLRAIGYKYSDLSKEFGKSEVALRSICTGKSFPYYGGPIVSKP